MFGFVKIVSNLENRGRLGEFVIDFGKGVRDFEATVAIIWEGRFRRRHSSYAFRRAIQNLSSLGKDDSGERTVPLS